MLLNLEGRTNLFVNQSSLNNTFTNKKRYRRNKETSNKYFSPKFIEEKISSTEHLNILNEYQDELKFLSINKKNSESSDNSQISKDSSTRDSDIVICVDSNSQETTEKINDNENFEIKKFKLQNNNSNDNKINIINLYNIHKSLKNKIGTNYKKISNLVDVATNGLKNPNSYNFEKDNDKICFEKIKKIINSNFEENSMIKLLINKFYHFDFSHSNIEKLVEKINNFLNNENNLINKFQNNTININSKINDKNFSKNKRDTSFYQHILIEKINNNNYESILSLSNDRDYMNSIKYISNKFSLNSEIKENSLIKAMKMNKKLLEDFEGKNNEIANRYELSTLKDILKNKKIRKKVKFCFRFLKRLSEKNFFKFLDENYLKYSDSLMDEKQNKNFFKNLAKLDHYDFSFFAYFLLGINYIDKSKINLSENELFSLIQIFLQFNKPENNEFGKYKKQRSKIMKLKGIKKEKKNNNIIRINLEEIFSDEPKNEHSINLIEDNDNFKDILQK